MGSLRVLPQTVNSKEDRMNDISDKNKTIIEMWNNGATGGDIAHTLSMTRSAVLGQIARLKQKGFILRVAKKQEVVKKTKEVKTDKGWKKKIEYVYVEKTVEEPQSFLDILELKYDSCRYIVGRDKNRGALYCGAAIDKSSYCKEHHFLCYYPPKNDIRHMI